MLLCFIASTNQCLTQCLYTSVPQWLNGINDSNGSAAQLLNVSKALRLNGSTAQRLNGSTLQFLSANTSISQHLNSPTPSTVKLLNGLKLQNSNSSTRSLLTNPSLECFTLQRSNASLFNFSFIKAFLLYLAVGIAPSPYQRAIAHPARQLAGDASCGRSWGQAALGVQSHAAHRIVTTLTAKKARWGALLTSHARFFLKNDHWPP